MRTAAALAIGEEQEWLSAREAWKLLGVHPKIVHFYKKNGTITRCEENPYLLIHRDEVIKLQQRGFLQRNTEEIVRARVDISYSPRFTILGNGGNNLTAVPVSLQTRKYMKVSAC